jgi:subtilisin family serine protease
MELSVIDKVFTDLLENVSKTDIVFIPWHIGRNEQINYTITELTKRCFVVAAAGNNSGLIEEYTPTSVPAVVVVGALNKSGVPAKFSSTSKTREIMWAPGTNIIVDGVPRTGTSVASAIYSALLANAIELDDFGYIERELDRLKCSLKQEIISS